jgi:hypothetical protein
MMVLPNALSKNAAASWLVGGGSVGSLDTGTVAINTTYHVHLIRRPDTGVVDIATSLSPIAPATGGANPIPAAYTQFRRIGSMRTSAGATTLAQFTQNGDEFLWSSPPADALSAAVPNGTAALWTLSLPTGIQVNARFEGYVNAATAGAQVYFSSPDQLDIATPNGTTAIVPSVSSYGPFSISIRTNTSGQIRVRGNTSGTATTFSTIGWIDRRGRDA